MKVRANNIFVSGEELGAIAQDDLSPELDAHISEILSTDIEVYQDEIDDCLETNLHDWYEVPGDFGPNDNVPRDRKQFRSFIKNGTPLSAHDAANLLLYLDDESATEQATGTVRLPRSFAKEIAVVSIYQAAKHITAADAIPAINVPVYREVQSLPTSEAARIAWIRSLNNGSGSATRDAYMQEFGRKREEEDAGKSLNNALALARACRFSLANVVRSHIQKTTN